MRSEFESNYSDSHSVVYYADTKKKKRGIAKKTVFLSIILIILFSGIFLIYSAGFIPITALLETKAPIGVAEEINIEYFAKYYPKISDLPILEKIKYSIYGTDEYYLVVEEDYNKRLLDEGYRLEYDGCEKIAGFQIRSYSYVKGLTAVGIITITNTKQQFGHKTIVFYSTGNALDYKELIEEHSSLSSLIA